MAAATRQIIDNKLLGQERFFDELGRFLESSGRNYSTASEPYAELILELCIISLNAIKLIQELSVNDTNRETLLCYRCRDLGDMVRWEQKIDKINATGNHACYSVQALLYGHLDVSPPLYRNTQCKGSENLISCHRHIK